MTHGTAVTYASVPFIVYKSLIYWRDTNLVVKKFILVARFVLYFKQNRSANANKVHFKSLVKI